MFELILNFNLSDLAFLCLITEHDRAFRGRERFPRDDLFDFWEDRTGQQRGRSGRSPSPEPIIAPELPREALRVVKLWKADGYEIEAETEEEAFEILKRLRFETEALEAIKKAESRVEASDYEKNYTDFLDLRYHDFFYDMISAEKFYISSEDRKDWSW